MNKLHLALVFVALSRAEQLSVSMIDYLDARSPFNLSTDEAITKYLPSRLKNLKKIILSKGIDNAIAYIKNDPDIDSYLFIIDNNEPYRLVAYSRNPELFNKTLSELHQIIEANCEANECCVETAIKEIVAITQQITNYAGYRWKSSAKDPIQYFVAYNTLVTINNTTYTIGASMPTTKTFADIIIPDRVEQVLKRIKKEGLKKIATTLNKSLDHQCFPCSSYKYPYRYVMHSEPWIGLSPQQATKLINPDYKLPTYNIEEIVKNIRATLKKEGNYCAYPWVDNIGENPVLKINYAKIFEYNKQQYFIGTGLAAEISFEASQDMQNLVKNCVKFVKNVGLANTISAAKKLNTAERYIFILEAQHPYKFVLHFDPTYDQHTTDEIQSHLQSLGFTKSNINDFAENIIEASEKKLGYHASKFFIDTKNPQKGTTITAFYSEMFEHHGKKYVVSTGIPIEHMFNEFGKKV